MVSYFSLVACYSQFTQFTVYGLSATAYYFSLILVACLRLFFSQCLICLARLSQKKVLWQYLHSKSDSFLQNSQTSLLNASISLFCQVYDDEMLYLASIYEHIFWNFSSFSFLLLLVFCLHCGRWIFKLERPYSFPQRKHISTLGFALDFYCYLLIYLFIWMTSSINFQPKRPYFDLIYFLNFYNLRTSFSLLSQSFKCLGKDSSKKVLWQTQHLAKDLVLQMLETTLLYASILAIGHSAAYLILYSSAISAGSQGRAFLSFFLFKFCCFWKSQAQFSAWMLILACPYSLPQIIHMMVLGFFTSTSFFYNFSAVFKTPFIRIQFF